jgi:hypothetical protein
MARSHYDNDNLSEGSHESQSKKKTPANTTRTTSVPGATPRSEFENLASTLFLQQSNMSVEDQLLRMAAIVQENEVHNKKIQDTHNNNLATVLQALQGLTTTVQGIAQEKVKPETVLSTRKHTTFGANQERRQSMLPEDSEAKESQATRQRRNRRARERSRSRLLSPVPRDGNTSKIHCLNDEKDGVLFKYWETEIQEKFIVNYYKFQTKASRMLFVFNRTEGRARSFLHPRYNHRAKDPYVNWEQIIETLERVFVNLHAQRLARKKYSTLLGEEKISIHDFIAEFTILADKAEIPHASRFDNFYNKLPPWVQDGLSVNLPNYLDLDSLFEAARRYSEEQYFIRENRKKRAEAKEKVIARPSRYTPGSSDIKPQRFTNEKPVVLYKPSPAIKTEPTTPVVRCYTCNQVGHKSPDYPQKVGKELKEIEDGEEELVGSEEDNQGKDYT